MHSYFDRLTAGVMILQFKINSSESLRIKDKDAIRIDAKIEPSIQLAH